MLKKVKSGMGHLFTLWYEADKNHHMTVKSGMGDLFTLLYKTDKNHLKYHDISL